jgi:acyl homoserine lactone synthase
MLQYIVGCRHEISEPIYQQLTHYRHAIFVRKLGWSLPNLAAGANTEEDEFDTESTIYIVMQLADGTIVGCARLLPTTRPYLLGSVFPTLLDGRAIPCSEKIWEISRFAVSHGDSSGLNSARQLCSRISQVVLKKHGECVVGVLSCAVERCLERLGVRLKRWGEPRQYDGQRIVAFHADARHGLAPIAHASAIRNARLVPLAPRASHEVHSNLS